MRRLFPIMIALAASVIVAAQQAVPTSTIRGRVIDVLTGQAVAGVAVSYRLQESSGRLWAAETDGEGRFTLRNVPPGLIEVSTSRPGYVDGAFGQRRPLGAAQAIELAMGDQVTGLDIRVWQEASVSGRVMSAAGRPIVGMPVVAMRLLVQNGTRYLQAAQTASTDASGRYEIKRIAPSTYAIALVSSSIDSPTARFPKHTPAAGSETAGYPTTYHPDSLQPDERSLIELRSGEKREEIDFTLADVPTFSVTGSVADLPLGQWEPEVSLRLAAASPIATTTSTATARVGSDGSFRFPSVRPGRYLMRVTAFPVPFWSSDTTMMTQRILGMDPIFTTTRFREGQPVGPLPPTPTVWAELPVTVSDRDLEGVTIVARPGARISGRVEFRGASAQPTSQQLLATPVAVMTADVRNFGLVPVGRVESDFRFTTVALPPGRYAVEPWPTPALLGSFAWSETWRLESTLHQGQVVTGGLITVGDTDVEGVTTVFSDSRTELAGVVRDINGLTRPDATIYIVPTDPGAWRHAREVLPTSRGRFKISGLLPGDYFVAAITGAPSEHWNAPAFLSTLTGFAQFVALVYTGNAPIEITVR